MNATTGAHSLAALCRNLRKARARTSIKHTTGALPPDGVGATSAKHVRKLEHSTETTAEALKLSGNRTADAKGRNTHATTEALRPNNEAFQQGGSGRDESGHAPSPSEAAKF